MNALREELSRALESLSAPRHPALRRSLREDALYATDLPAAAPEAVPLFLRTVREKGWTAAERNGWIDLDQVPETPPAGWKPGKPGPETACCLSLLRRRKPAGNGAPEETGRVIRKLIKAGEENGENWEAVCAGLHREWAVRLRTGRGIPPVPEAFFTAEGQPEPEDPAAGRPKERSGGKC